MEKHEYIYPNDYIEEYVHGVLSRQELIRLLSEYPYAASDTTDGYDSLLVDPPGAFSEVGSALRHGKIDAELYDEVLDNVCGQDIT